QHWQNIIIAACEQSERATLPTLHTCQSIADVFKNIDADIKIMLHPYGPSFHQLSTYSPKKVAMLIGPEGGLSDNEVSLAKKNNFLHLPLGRRILRTETATISALTLAQYLWGDYV
ncbi:MAG: RsmE family RNA methyltransferase, partial [Ostreibacterium sp.]